MKKLMILASLVLLLISCSEPIVTAEYKVEEQIARETFYGGRQITFRGTAYDNYVVFDDNKQCPHSSYSFRTFKPFRGAKINKGDICIHCHKSWSLHKDK